MADLKVLENSLGYKFQKISYLKNALTHTSYINEHKNARARSNERMEFLGDSVLSLAISEYLYANYKKLPEGELSKIRASVVCEESLAKLAQKLNLSAYLLMGKGELMCKGNQRPSVTSDAMESVIAAIYLDSNFATVKRMILGWLKSEIVEAAEHGGRETDFKSALQEYCQSKGSVPQYEIVTESGPDHNKTFEIKVTLADGQFASGKGPNKKKAQQSAARAMLDILKIKI